MSIETTLIAHYKAVRERLHNPPNAVPDPWRVPKQSIWQLTSIPAPPAPTPVEKGGVPQLPPPPPIPEPTPLRGALTFSSTLEIVASDFGVTPQDLIKKGRTKKLSVPRQIAIYFGCKQGRTLSWMARYLARDHSTCIYAREKISSLISEDVDFANRVQSIEAKLNAHYQSSLSNIGQPNLEEGSLRTVPKHSIHKVA